MCVKVEYIPMVFDFLPKKSEFSIQKHLNFCRSKIFSIEKQRLHSKNKGGNRKHL